MSAPIRPENPVTPPSRGGPPCCPPAPIKGMKEYWDGFRWVFVPSDQRVGAIVERVLYTQEKRKFP